MNKISVIVPVYKVEKFLPQCLDSLLAQTFQEWQAICVDDGSPDNCGNMLDKYAQKDNRIKVIHQTNKGLSEARNAAYKYVDTVYTIFLDSDDVLHYQALELAYNSIEKTKADILWFDVKKFADGDNVEQSKINHLSRIKIYNNPFKFYAIKTKWFTNRRNRMCGIVAGKIYKSEYVKQTNFTSGVFPGEDNLFTLEITAKINKLAHLKENLYLYRQHQASIMHSLDVGKVKNNLRKEVNGYVKMRDRLIKQKLSLERMKIFERYLAEIIFFKKIFKPFIKKQDIAQTKEYIDNLINSGEFDFRCMKFKFRVALLFYQNNLPFLSRLLCCL